jgi:hypothetical protein
MPIGLSDASFIRHKPCKALLVDAAFRIEQGFPIVAGGRVTAGSKRGKERRRPVTLFVEFGLRSLQQRAAFAFIALTQRPKRIERRALLGRADQEITFLGDLVAVRQ